MRPRLRPLAAVLALAVAASQASAQVPGAPRRAASGELAFVPEGVRHAGVYHVATATWSRGRQDRGAGAADVVYNNSLPSGYFSTVGATGGMARGAAVIDAGGLPTPANTSGFATTPDRTTYTIDAFEFGYCDLNTAPHSSGWRFSFYDSYRPCTSPEVAPAASYEFTGLPAGGCWTMVFDLSGDEFCLQGDGGGLAPGWQQGDPDRDSFGFSATYIGPSPTGTFLAGPLLAGDPDNDEPGYAARNTNGPPTCGHGTGTACAPAPAPLAASATYLEPPGLCAATGASSLAPFDGSGYLMDDGFWVEQGAASTCIFFGGYFNATGCGTASSNPFGSMHLVMTARAGECAPRASVGTSYCSAAPNSTGAPADLALLGSPVLADDDLELRVTQLPARSYGVFLTSRDPGLLPHPAGGPGNFCLRANVGRFALPGQVRRSDPLGVLTLDAAISEWSNQALPLFTGTYPAIVGQRTHFQLWYRDVVQGSSTSNFSDGEFIDWE